MRGDGSLGLRIMDVARANQVPAMGSDNSRREHQMVPRVDVAVWMDLRSARNDKHEVENAEHNELATLG